MCSCCKHCNLFDLPVAIDASFRFISKRHFLWKFIWFRFIRFRRNWATPLSSTINVENHCHFIKIKSFGSIDLETFQSIFLLEVKKNVMTAADERSYPAKIPNVTFELTLFTLSTDSTKIKCHAPYTKIWFTTKTNFIGQQKDLHTDRWSEDKKNVEK